MVCRLIVLILAKHFLIELFSVTQPGILDFHVLCAHLQYHTLGKVGDSHRHSHIEDKDFSAIAHSTGLENQTASLRNEHKEAYDVRMGNGDGTSLLDLLLENRNH